MNHNSYINELDQVLTTDGVLTIADGVVRHWLRGQDARYADSSVLVYRGKYDPDGSLNITVLALAEDQGFRETYTLIRLSPTYWLAAPPEGRNLNLSPILPPRPARQAEVTE